MKALSVNMCREFLICQRYLKSTMASDQNNLQQVQCFTENCNKKFYINSARLRYTIYHKNTTKKPMNFTVCLLTPFFKDQTIWFYAIFSDYTKVVLMWGIFKLQDAALASLLIRPIPVQATQKAKLIATSEEFMKVPNLYIKMLQDWIISMDKQEAMIKNRLSLPIRSRIENATANLGICG